jgi:hypothetical protein
VNGYKNLTQINFPVEGPEDTMGFTMKEKQTLTREYAPPVSTSRPEIVILIDKK